MSTVDESNSSRNQGSRNEGKKPFPKTFGDVMKGIPAGKGMDSSKNREGKGLSSRGETEKRTLRDRKKTEEPRKCPVIVRKPLPLASKKPEDSPSTASTSSASTTTFASKGTPGANSSELKKGEGKQPKTVFRRADGLNLPPREAEAEKFVRFSTTESSIPAEWPESEESFAELFAQSEKACTPKKFQVGEKVIGRIVQISNEQAFLDLGGKGEGMIDIAELTDTHGNLIVSVGELLEGYVLALAGDQDSVVITKVLSKGAQKQFLAEAQSSGIPVEGLVTGQNKGGLEVDFGGLRGFCPSSQVDTHFTENLASFIGQHLRFKVMEVRDRDIVLSRRLLLEEEAAKKALELRSRLSVGARAEGTVTSVRDFGAFIDLGGLEGLVHVSELGHGRIAHPKDLLQVGQRVEVEVLRIDPPKEGEKNERIALSMKALQQDPWQSVVASIKNGQRVRGKVVRMQPFGAFVEIEPGVDGLIHISALGATKRITHPQEIVSEGEEVECIVEAIDLGQKRISLRRLTAEEIASPAGIDTQTPKVGNVQEVSVDKVEPFGLFVKWPGGRGLIHNSEMGTPRGADLRKQFPPGTVFSAEIIEIDGQGRIKLSKASAERSAEQAEYRTFIKKQNKQEGKGFCTLGDLLKMKK